VVKITETSDLAAKLFNFEANKRWSAAVQEDGRSTLARRTMCRSRYTLSQKAWLIRKELHYRLANRDARAVPVCLSPSPAQQRGSGACKETPQRFASGHSGRKVLRKFVQSLW